ncbi:MAG TPA: hypothetical protein VM450_17605, partial [Thermomicrobiales bacterium]|nr:hypothetical protein [Thermomicrobiales bacterium]
MRLRPPLPRCLGPLLIVVALGALPAFVEAQEEPTPPPEVDAGVWLAETPTEEAPAETVPAAEPTAVPPQDEADAGVWDGAEVSPTEPTAVPPDAGVWIVPDDEVLIVPEEGDRILVIPDASDKILICHATGSASNPYIPNLVSDDGAYDGHVDHPDDFIPAPVDAEGSPYCPSGEPTPTPAPPTAPPPTEAPTATNTPETIPN